MMKKRILFFSGFGVPLIVLLFVLWRFVLSQDKREEYPVYGDHNLRPLVRIAEFEPVTVSDVLHKIRVDAYMGSSSSADLYFLKDSFAFETAFPGGGYPIYKNGFGEWVVVKKSFVFRNGEKHPDQLLAAFVEAGLPMDSTLNVDGYPVSIEQLLKSSQAMCVPEQEIEWTFLAHLLSMPGDYEWKNRFGDSVKLGGLVDVLLAKKRGEYSCSGTHLLFALAQALNRDKADGFLTQHQKRRIRSMLQEASAQLSRSQYSYGAWGYDWDGKQGDSRQTVLQMISVTGHHLEWIAQCEPSMRPAPAVIDRAIEFFLRGLDRLDAAEIELEYCGLSHGAIGISVLLERQRDHAQNIER